MKKKVLALLLLLALLCGLAGCGSSFYTCVALLEGPIDNVWEALRISPGDLIGLDEMLETADGSETAHGNKLDIIDTQGDDGATMRILGTLGDGYHLRILVAITLPDSMGEKPSEKTLDKLFLTFPEIGPVPYTEMQKDMFAYDQAARCVYVLLQISFDAPGYTDQPLTLRFTDDRNYGLEEILHCSVSWIPHNRAPRLTAEDRGATCTISPLGLNVKLPIDLDDVEGVELDPNDPLECIRLSLKVVYRDGSVLTDFGGGWEADPIQVTNVQPYEHIFFLDALDHVEFLGYKFSFNGQEGGPP